MSFVPASPDWTPGRPRPDITATKSQAWEELPWDRRGVCGDEKASKAYHRLVSVCNYAEYLEERVKILEHAVQSVKYAPLYQALDENTKKAIAAAEERSV